MTINLSYLSYIRSMKIVLEPVNSPVLSICIVDVSPIYNPSKKLWYLRTRHFQPFYTPTTSSAVHFGLKQLQGIYFGGLKYQLKSFKRLIYFCFESLMSLSQTCSITYIRLEQRKVFDQGRLLAKEGVYLPFFGV